MTGCSAHTVSTVAGCTPDSRLQKTIQLKISFKHAVVITTCLQTVHGSFELKPSLFNCPECSCLQWLHVYTQVTMLLKRNKCGKSEIPGQQFKEKV